MPMPEFEQIIAAEWTQQESASAELREISAASAGLIADVNNVRARFCAITAAEWTQHQETDAENSVIRDALLPDMPREGACKICLGNGIYAYPIDPAYHLYVSGHYPELEP